MLGLSADPIHTTLWVHSTKAMFSVDWGAEKTNIWSAYAKIGKLNQAIEATDDPDHHSLLYGLLADKQFSNG